MDYQFREEVCSAKKAAMGEMFNLAKKNIKTGDKLINFASGHPSTDVFQDKLIKKYMNLAVDEIGKNEFHYDTYYGYEPLRKSLKKFINTKGNVIKQDDDLMITYGSTEAVFLTASALIDSGDKVIVEMPSYVNAIKAFQLLGGEVIGVRMEDDGVDLEELEKIMRGGVKLFYTIPNFGNPSGITMSYQKRQAVYELAVKYQVPILEDNVYGDLRYRNEPLPNIKEFDTEGIVIYVGSVSKWIAPAMRVGFMAANQEVIKHIAAVKNSFTINDVPDIVQHALWKMFEENDMYAQIQKVCNAYSKKLFLMEESMDKYFPPCAKRSSPDGGMYIWVTLPDGADVQEFCGRSAIQLHIPITPGNDFCVEAPESCTSMRFNFAKESLEDIAFGIEKVGGLMKHYIDT